MSQNNCMAKANQTTRKGAQVIDWHIKRLPCFFFNGLNITSYLIVKSNFFHELNIISYLIVKS